MKAAEEADMLFDEEIMGRAEKEERLSGQQVGR